MLRLSIRRVIPLEKKHKKAKLLKILLQKNCKKNK